jgi:hypothetical protein
MLRYFATAGKSATYENPRNSVALFLPLKFVAFIISAIAVIAIDCSVTLRRDAKRRTNRSMGERL